MALNTSADGAVLNPSYSSKYLRISKDIHATLSCLWITLQGIQSFMSSLAKISFAY